MSTPKPDHTDTNGPGQVRILMLEDTPEDAELIEMQLDEAGITFVSQRVETRDAFILALDEFQPDIILSDYRLPSFDGRAGLAIARERRPDTPVIMVTGAVGDELAVDLLKAGARDYVLKDRLARLPSAVVRALSEQREASERIAAEAALRETQQRYREVFETSPDVIFVIEVQRDGRFKFGGANRSWEAIMGVRAADVQGRYLEEVFAADMVGTLLVHYRRCVDGAVTTSYEDQIVAAGGRRHFHTTLTPICDDGGSVIRLFGVARDITDRKRAEEAVKASEELYRSFVAASPDGVAVMDGSGKVIFASQKVAELLKEPADTDFKGKNALNWIAPEDRERAAANLSGILAGQRSHSEEYRVLQKDGNSVFLEINGAPITGSEGRTTGVVTVVRDTTSRRAALAALRESERHLREVYENSPLAYQSLDEQAVFLDVNPAWCALMGFARDEAMGTPFAAYLSPASLQSFADGFPAFKTAGEIHAIEFEVIRKDGSHCQIELDGRIARDANGDFRQMHCILHDITERKKSEAAVRRFNRALKTLSSGNEALVRAINEKELLNRMCNVLIEHGGYRAAWIGYPPTTPDQPVTPAAWAGKEVGCFSGAGPCPKPADRLDPTASALASGDAVVIRDMEHDPAYERCRADVLQAGFKASVNLPLKDANGSLGVLTLYSAESDAFDVDEVRLLTELAEDLSYGIRTLRMRDDREKNLRRLQATMEATIQALSSTVELRDPYTAGHQRRVAKLAVSIARELGLTEDRIHGLFLAAMVHDIGKIHIPAEVLTRPGKLSAVEYSLVQTHVSAASEILESVDFPWPIAEMVRQHHERLDGSGYPGGLKADELMTESRILAVSDVVEAMSSHRPYRPGLGVDAALEEIQNGRGTLFDADVVDVCVSLFRDEGFHFE